MTESGSVCEYRWCVGQNLYSLLLKMIITYFQFCLQDIWCIYNIATVFLTRVSLLSFIELNRLPN